MTMHRFLLSLVLLAGCSRSGGAKPSAPSTQEPVTLGIVAMNDFHGGLYEVPLRDQPERTRGGLPWLVAAVDALRADDPDMLLLDGGDLFQGSWPVNQTHGMGSVRAANLLGIDAAAVGNHEFDYGGVDGGHATRGRLEAAAKQADFSWLSANIYEGESRWQPEGIAPWTVIEREGVSIGIIGLTTVDTPETTLKKNVADLRFGDVVEAAREGAAAVRAEGAQVVLAVGHLTGNCKADAYATQRDDCQPDGEIGRLLTELPEGTLDVLVAGHAHTVLGMQSGKTFVMENRSRGGLLGRLDLVVGPNGVDHAASKLHPAWELIHDKADPGCTGEPFPTAPLDVGGRTLTPSAEAIALVEALEAEAGSLCDKIGCATRPIGRSRAEESLAGDLVADAMLAAFDGADIAIQNSGGLRADLPEGDLRREHVQALMPFENRLLLLELTGEQVELMFRLGSSGAHGILQVAGASYAFDAERSEGSDLDGDGEVAQWETNRLCAVDVNGPLDPKRTYKVVTTDFLVGGGDHMGPAFEGAPVVDEGPLLRDAIEAYVAAHEGCLGAHAAAVSSRIRIGACP